MGRCSRVLFGVILICCLYSGGGSSSQELVGIDQIWKARISIADESQFEAAHPAFYQMTISPRRQGDDYYVPYDLTDAWLELERMLPVDFVRLAERSLDEENCILLDDDLYNIEQALEDYVLHHWFVLDGHPTRFARYSDILFSVYPTQASDYSYYSLISNMVICGYLKYIRHNEFPEIAAFVRFYQELIVQEFEGMRRTPE
jgi:hypothetical protein